ncbi:coenzyme A biosynthesis bifunctional protein CoaBC [Methyloglobulus morosus KoM1]|uniref:Coenzyme A biosynthesis bifunctional protein CoaBC n=1 Tax=Methyloglobulus morosus KoM1 TaxID=1116472 RepID=V5BQP1_9GAMM|nr:coenzyme A biosynthesis bifunctional protein CoaBC [Methyloglobulus morosus KoM1]
MDTTIRQHVLLAICGGIAAYKSAELVRLLRKQGCDVRVVMTESAQVFVGPLTFQALSGNPVHTELLDADEENAMGHINLARWADVIIIAPATANMIAKCAHGLADDLVSTLFLAATCPIYIAPAMNQAMWNKAMTQDNIRKLKVYGVSLIGPNSGDQACGETGEGRMAEAAEICERLLAETKAGVLQNLKVLISAGPTREYLDPVRFITNRSSGKMGYALATAALRAGAQVSLVSGPVNQPAPMGVEIVFVETAAEMYDAVLAQADHSDIYIGAAAVADYSPVAVEKTKIKKQAEQTSLILQKTKDILADVALLSNAPFTVGFAAETNDLEAYAQEKLYKKNVGMIAANWVGREQGGFDSEQNAFEIFWHNGRTSLPMTDKNQLAEQLISIIATKFNEKNRV